jgi:nicotinamide mononucleotide (NMN) deamidase PncC
MTGVLEVSDNLATLHTPEANSGYNFLSVIDIRASGGQVWILRNTITYTNQAKNYLATIQHAAMDGASRIIISRNVVWGGVSDDDSQLLNHANVGTPVYSADSVLEITHNYIDTFRAIMKIDQPEKYGRIIYSYNVVNYGLYQPGNSINIFSSNVVAAELCLNRHNHTYLPNTAFANFVGTGTLLPCPLRTLTNSLTAPRSASHTESQTSHTQTHTLVNHTRTPTNISLPFNTSATSSTTEASDGRAEGSNATQSVVTIIVPKGVPDEVFIVGVTVGSITTPLALLETASSIQMAAIFTVMPCRTMDGSRTIMSHVLSPLQLSGTNASDLLGSFVLLSTISAVYFAVAMLVLRLARRFGDQEGDAPDMRVFKAKLFLWYPRVPMTVAVLLLPGMSFESCSLLYGVKSGGPWWERVIGAVGLLVSLAIVAFHIAVGIVVGRRARKQSHRFTNDSPTYVHSDTCTNENTYGEALSPTAAKSNQDDRDDEAVIVFEDDEDEPKGDGCEIADRELIDVFSPSTPHQELVPEKVDTYVVTEETGVTSLESSVYFVTYTEEAKARVPAVLAAMLLANGRWNKHVLRSMWFAVVNCRRDVVSYVCAHNCVRILLVSIVAAVDGKNLLECRIVQGIIAAICFLHAVGRVYRVPILTPLQAGQSVCVGLLACASFIQNADAQQAFVIVMMLLSLLTTVLCGVVFLVEVRVNGKESAPADLDDSKVPFYVFQTTLMMCTKGRALVVGFPLQSLRACEGDWRDFIRGFYLYLVLLYSFFCLSKGQRFCC